MVLSISYTALELAVSILYKSMSAFINSFEVGPIVGGQVGEICKVFKLCVNVLSQDLWQFKAWMGGFVFDRRSLGILVSGTCIFLYRRSPVVFQVYGKVEKTGRRFCVAKV